jgi:hypothetical protein
MPCGICAIHHYQTAELAQHSKQIAKPPLGKFLLTIAIIDLEALVTTNVIASCCFTESWVPRLYSLQQQNGGG